MTATPLVLLHGLGQSPLAWEDVVPLLYTSRPLLTPWIPGTRPIDPRPLGLSASAAALDQELMLEGKDAVDVCGVSLGGMVALQLAADFPERVRRLVVIAAQVRPPRTLIRLQRPLIRMVPRQRFIDAGVSKSRMLDLLDLIADADLSAELTRITASTLVLCGTKDRPNQPAARQIAAAIPGAELALVPGAGHELNRQQPRELARLLTDFLDG